MRKAFTLIELFVVVAILALMIILGIWAYKLQLLKAFDARRKSDLSKIKVAVEEYEKDHDCYPLPELVVCKGTGLNPYINQVPCDPQNGGTYKYERSEGNCPYWFRIGASLGNSKDTQSIQLGCQYGCGSSLSYNYYVSSPNAPEPEKGGSTPPATGTPQPGEANWGCRNRTCFQLKSSNECQPNFQQSLCPACEAGNTGECL